MRKFLFTFTLCLIVIIAGVTNLFILNEPSPVLAWGGISVSIISGSIVGHHKIRENKQKAAADRERERVEAVRLEESLELWSGKDWAAQRTIDRINKELGLEDPDDDFFDPEGAIIAGGVYADEIEITGDAIEVRSGDGQLIANFIDTCKDCGGHHDEWIGCLPHALSVIHKFVDNKESDERLSQPKPQTATEMVDEAARRIAAERTVLATEQQAAGVSIIELSPEVGPCTVCSGINGSHSRTCPAGSAGAH